MTNHFDIFKAMVTGPMITLEGMLASINLNFENQDVRPSIDFTKSMERGRTVGAFTYLTTHGIF